MKRLFIFLMCSVFLAIASTDDNFATIAASNKDTISKINSVAASSFGK